MLKVVSITIGKLMDHSCIGGFGRRTIVIFILILVNHKLAMIELVNSGINTLGLCKVILPWFNNVNIYVNKILT